MPRDDNKSKRIDRIVISCVTFDTVMVTDPIEHYDATKAYLVHYSKKDDDEYNECFKRVLEILEEGFNTVVLDYGMSEFGYDSGSIGAEIKKQKNLTVIDVKCEKVYVFQDMLRVLFSIIRKERSISSKNPIYVNVSAGTSEFSAAALIVSMMFENVEAFSVGTMEYTIVGLDPYKDRETGKFIGISKAVHPPRAINGFKVSQPEKNFTLALRLYKEMGFPSATKMIRALKDSGLWNSPDGDLPNEKMRYQRRYIDEWLKDGLIEKNGRGKYSLTPQGQFAIETYYTEVELLSIV
ncbi:MAG: DUF6293 family protein [Methanomassiliicoccaceae archaeon]|nr:DUF6293 family protein [Methanomassiliicoccaceae archaeon]